MSQQITGHVRITYGAAVGYPEPERDDDYDDYEEEEEEEEYISWVEQLTPEQIEERFNALAAQRSKQGKMWT